MVLVSEQFIPSGIRLICPYDCSEVIVLKESLDSDRAIDKARVSPIVVLKCLYLEGLNLICRVAPEEIAHDAASRNLVVSFDML